ncbi:bleomycin resistance protein [Rhizobium binxianense]
MSGNPDRIEVLPVLPSLDIAETLSFYRDQLGFKTIVHQAPAYLILRRDGMELHFWLTDEARLCENSSIYLRGGGIDALHAEFRAAGVKRMTDIELRPWNMVEFYIHDPHGNLLRFGRVPQG